MFKTVLLYLHFYVMFGEQTFSVLVVVMFVMLDVLPKMPDITLL